MKPAISLAACVLLGLASAQTPSKNTRERHPKIDTWKCTKRGGCHRQRNAIVLDSGYHPTHQNGNPDLGCFSWHNGPTGLPNATVCPDETTCAKNCIMDGISDYSKFGVNVNGPSVMLDMLSPEGAVLTPRVYLLSEDETHYEMLQLTGNEFSFDVDMSKLPCGMNGALFLSEMDKTGGKGKLNPGGAAYGTGYCDAQCNASPFINGVGNVHGKGSCCNEMDLWEANDATTALTAHTCNITSLYECEGAECGSEGVCDKNGCGYNPYALDNHNYYGPEKRSRSTHRHEAKFQVDTNRPFTVITQFPAENGKLTQISRLYVQDGKVIQNAAVNVAGPPHQNYLDDKFCDATSASRFMSQGATAGMGEAISRGMVLVMCIWWDESGFMNWLDSGDSGPCNATEGSPATIRAIQPNPSITFSKLKWGEIGSTFSTAH